MQRSCTHQCCGRSDDLSMSNARVCASTACTICDADRSNSLAPRSPRNSESSRTMRGATRRARRELPNRRSRPRRSGTGETSRSTVAGAMRPLPADRRARRVRRRYRPEERRRLHAGTRTVPLASRGNRPFRHLRPLLLETPPPHARRPRRTAPPGPVASSARGRLGARAVRRRSRATASVIRAGATRPRPATVPHVSPVSSRPLKFLLELGRDRERDRFWPFAAERQSHGRVQPALQRPSFSLAQLSEQLVGVGRADREVPRN